jgi:hypothetical protein
LEVDCSYRSSDREGGRMDSIFFGKKGKNQKRKCEEPGEVERDNQDDAREQEDKNYTYEDRVEEGITGIMDDVEET